MEPASCAGLPVSGPIMTDLSPVRSADGGKLVHVKAYYTLNEIPHP